MRLKKIAPFLFVLAVVLVFANQIFAQIELPRITTACENKNGDLYAFNDGFSSRKESGKLVTG